MALVTCTIAVQGKRGGLVTEVLLCKGEASADGDLCTDDTVATKEGRGEDVHRATLSVGHAVLTTEEFSEDTFDAAPTHDRKGVTAVGRDDAVLGRDTIFETDRDGFLGQGEQRGERGASGAYLSDGEMAEATDEFCLVEGVGGHFHAAHGLHVLVHFEELVLVDLNFKGGWVAFVSAERVLV